MKDVDKKNCIFLNITWLMIDLFFPIKKIKFFSSDKEWITPNIKNLIKQRQKAHFAGKIDLRNHLVKKIRSEIRKAKIHYNEKKAHLFHTSNPREWYKHINKIIGNKRFDLNLINIPEVANKPVNEQIRNINDHFSKRCKKYPPLKEFKLRETNN